MELCISVCVRMGYPCVCVVCVCVFFRSQTEARVHAAADVACSSGQDALGNNYSTRRGIRFG